MKVYSLAGPVDVILHDGKVECDGDMLRDACADTATRTITINTDLSEIMRRHRLYHELFHIAAFDYALDLADGEEERAAEMFATWMMGHAHHASFGDTALAVREEE